MIFLLQCASAFNLLYFDVNLFYMPSTYSANQEMYLTWHFFNTFFGRALNIVLNIRFYIYWLNNAQN